MYWLIEDTEKIEILTRVKIQEAYVEIIPFSYTNHPVENNISCIYIKSLDGSKGYMVVVDHSEAIHVTLEQVKTLIESIGKIYVINKKDFLHYFYHHACISIPIPPPTYIQEQTQAHTYFYAKHPNQNDINTIIPIVKHYESCEANFFKIKPYLKNPINPFYNNKAPIVFNMIEGSGIKVDPTLYKHYFNKDTNGYVYTQYNLNTTTTRPSNTFGGVNYSALNKENEERECFIPRNDVFVEMDISAYHPTLLANLLGYTFDSNDIHGDFAKMYGVDYAKAKEITFKQLYGGVWKEYQHLEFFKKVIAYTDSLWDEFQYMGYIKCPISGYEFYRKDLKNMNPQKLLNYLLQNLETSTNILILWDIFKILRGKKTKLVLYVYDSILLDVDRTEKETLKEILEIFNKYKLQVKVKKGTNYHNIC
jgi:hypothetical protein